MKKCKLGDELYLGAFSVWGALTEEKCEALVNEIISSIGMQAAHPPRIFRYPVDGKGEGFVYIQTIITSFITIDVWPTGAYLVACSCMPFENRIIRKTILSFGLRTKPCRLRRLSFHDAR